jgi:hypothetical protein
MKFKIWVEEEGASMGSMTPEMMPPIKSKESDAPASDQVKRTGLQPQVDAQELSTKSKKEQDAILAIDAGIEHMSTNMPDGDDTDTPKLNQFKQMWDQLMTAWDELKMSDAPGHQVDALGDAEDRDYTDMMKDHPNMVPVTGDEQGPHGPGIFGNST